MDNVEFTLGARPALTFEEKNKKLFVSQSLKGFAEATTPHCIASAKKFTIYNKQPAAIKIIARVTAKGGDLAVESPLVAATPLDYDSDLFVVALQNGTVLLLRGGETPDGNPTLEKVEAIQVPDVQHVVAAQRPGTVHNVNDPRAGKLIIAVTSKGALLSINAANTDPTAEPCGEAGGAVEAVAAGSGIVAFARNNRVTVRTADRLGGQDLLAKPWLPHGEDKVDFVHVFGKTDGPATILTSAAGEARLWTLKDAATLHQTIMIHGAPKDALKSVDPQEEFFFLVDKKTGAVTVMEINVKGPTPCVDRVTEWSIDEEIVSLSSAIRKVTTDGLTRIEVAIVVRAAAGLQRFAFDNTRLHGPGNVDTASPKVAAAGSSPATASSNDSVKKWFANSSATTPAATTAASATPAGFTHITSTTGGLTTTKSSVDARAAQEALAELQAKFVTMLSQFDSAIVALERQASDSLGVLRARAPAAIAQGEAAGQQQLMDSNLAGKTAQNGASAYVINQDVLTGFTNAITEAATITVQQALSAGLKHHAGNAADRALTLIAKEGDKEALQLPKVTQIPSMQALVEALEKSQAQQNDLFRRQKEQDQAKYKKIVRDQVEKSAKMAADVKKYLTTLTTELSGLKEDVLSMKSTAPAAKVEDTEDSAYAEAIRLAEAGQWSSALFKAVNFGHVSLLMRFLETDLIRTNEKEIVNPAHITVPVFVAVAQQLTTDLNASAGLIPSRIFWLYNFTLALDDVLADDQDRKHAKVIDAARVDISNVLDALGEVEKGNLDRVTKRYITVVKKALAPHGL